MFVVVVAFRLSVQHSKPLENDPSKDQGGKDPGEEVANGTILALALREGGGAEGVDLFHSGVIGCGVVRLRFCGQVEYHCS